MQTAVGKDRRFCNRFLLFVFKKMQVMRKIAVFCSLLLAWSFTVAQVTDDFEDFAPQTSFDSFQQNMEQRFANYQDSINRRFAKELERQWVEYERFDGETRTQKPKPSHLPVAPLQKQHTSDELPAGTIHEPTPVEPDVVAPSESAVPVPDNSQLTESALVTLAPLSFFSQQLTCVCPRQYVDLQLKDLTEKSISTFWKSLSCAGLEQFVQQCRSQQQQLQLNDWGLFELVKSYSQQIFGGRYAEQTVFTVFILNQLEYNVRIGRVDNQLVCLIPSLCKIYAVSYMKGESSLLYVFSLYPTPSHEGSIFTYTFRFPKAKSSFDLNIRKPLLLADESAEKVFSAKFCGEKISLPVNQSIIRFYDNYPQVDLLIYANAEPDLQWVRRIEKELGPALEGKSEYEKVSLLLSFLHKSFLYKTDNEQFGREKFFFCEENFYYDGNDCEDRSVLFSFLVRKLVGLDVILLDYPDHIATAVHFNDDSVAGDYYLCQGKKFVVCDPTYVGASVGETMPQFKNVKPVLIPLSK